MSSRSYGPVLQQIDRLFHGGSGAGQPEWQLLNRYLTRGDETAFEAIVARHGPMVLGVCRRVLADPHAVEDAFQATFLVLVRKARTLGERDAIGHWLYGVAHRVALRARADAVRRNARETPRGELCVLAPFEDAGGNELASLLDAELSRLPAKYRAPIVLCYLEDCTHEQAAAQLGWPVGTVKGRLARARELLRERLTRRGLAPAAALVTTALTRSASAALPEPLVRATVRAAAPLTSAGVATGVVSTTISQLTEGVLSTMFAAKVKVSAAVALSCAGLLFGAWVLAQEGHGRRGSGVAQPSIKAPADATSQRATEQALAEVLDRPVPLDLRKGTLESVLKQIRAATADQSIPTPAGLPIYVDPKGLEEAGATVQSAVPTDAVNPDAPLRDVLDGILRPLKLAATTRDGVLVISSRPEIALIEIGKLADQLRSTRPGADASKAGGDLAGVSPAAWLKRLPGRKMVYHSDTSPNDSTPEDEAKTRAILDALNKRIPMAFGNEVPLEDVLGYLREETKSKELPDGLPIYVDPVGLLEAEKTLQSPIQIDIKGVALRETLRLTLKQLGLVYEVRDGLLTITSNESEDVPSVPILDLASMAQRGELSLDEMKQLVEMFRVRAEVGRYASGLAPTSGGEAAGKTPPPTNRQDATTDGAADATASEAIEAALGKIVTLQFNDTPLDAALKSIQRTTVSHELPYGIPVYIAPSQKNEIANVSIDLKRIRLRTGLRLLLSQVGRTFRVQDGLLIIGPVGSPELDAGALEDETAHQARRRRLGGLQ